MRKRDKYIVVGVLSAIILGVASYFGISLLLGNKPEEELTDHQCKSTPLSESCLVLTTGPVFDDSIHYGEKAVFTEKFDEDYVGDNPFSWILYSSDTYKIGAVEAKVLEEEGNKFVSLYSNGIHGPLYNPIDRSLIFTREFNLDELGYGVAEADILLPANENNEVYFEVATGAVNVLGINIKKDGKVSVISGGVYHNYQGTLEVENTDVTLQMDKWYRFRLEWNQDEDQLVASMYDDNDQLVKLFEGKFHISVREGANREGTPVVPNILRFTMPKMVNRDGYAYVDNIKVDSVIESGE